MNLETSSSARFGHGSRTGDSAEPQRRIHARRILIADDDPLMRQLVVMVLEKNGFAVNTAADGEQAWEALHREQYDLLITDNEMPRIKGIQLVERARKEGLSLPIIMVSGTVDPEVTRTAPDLHLAAVLPKPFYPQAFLDTVRSALCITNAKEAQSRILLADDDALVRGSLAAVLELEGFVVDEAQNGIEALNRVIEHAPDLVLLDLNMPQGDGWTAFSQLDRVTPFLPVVVITARPNQYPRAVQLGVDAFMEKPLNIPILVGAIKRLTGEARHRPPRRISDRSVTQWLNGSAPGPSHPE